MIPIFTGNIDILLKNALNAKPLQREEIEKLKEKENRKFVFEEPFIVRGKPINSIKQYMDELDGIVADVEYKEVND